MTEIILASPAGVVTVCVRDDCFFDGLPGVDVKVALATEQAAVIEFDKWHSSKIQSKGGRGKIFGTRELVELNFSNGRMDCGVQDIKDVGSFEESMRFYLVVRQLKVVG